VPELVTGGDRFETAASRIDVDYVQAVVSRLWAAQALTLGQFQAAG
jgi:hypothetical protein